LPRLYSIILNCCLHPVCCVVSSIVVVDVVVSVPPVPVPVVTTIVVVVTVWMHVLGGIIFPFLHFIIVIDASSSSYPSLQSNSYFPFLFGPSIVPFGNEQPLGCIVVVTEDVVVTIGPVVPIVVLVVGIVVVLVVVVPPDCKMQAIDGFRLPFLHYFTYSHTYSCIFS